MTPSFGRFMMVQLITMVGTMAASSISLFIGCSVSNAETAIFMMSLIVIPNKVFSGYLVNLHDISIYVRWMQYTSPVRYLFEALLRNEFEENSNYENGEALLENYHLDLGMWPCILILLFIAIVFRILALLALKLTVKRVQ